MADKYDMIIIGAGPSGLNAAISAEKAGLKYLIIEKGVLVNSIFNFPINMTFFSTSQVLEIGNIPFISHGDKPTRREALEYYRRLAQTFNMEIKLREIVTDVTRVSDEYQVKTDKSNYACKYLVVSTGYYDTPHLMGVKGEDLKKVKHYYDDPHIYIGTKVLVVGAANSACDVALECHYKGAEVTMAVRSAELYKKVKYWIRPNIDNRIKEGSIKAYFNTLVKEIKEESVVLETPEGEIKIENDFVLAMTGYKPNFGFLKNIGLNIKEDENCIPEFNEDTLESNLKNVYIAGVICAGMSTSKLFIENTRDHGDKIINDILRKSEANVVA